MLGFCLWDRNRWPQAAADLVAWATLLLLYSWASETGVGGGEGQSGDIPILS